MVSQMKRMDEEDKRLKKMYAELSMQNDLLKEALGKKKPSQRREMALYAAQRHEMSVALACRAFSISETVNGEEQESVLAEAADDFLKEVGTNT